VQKTLRVDGHGEYLTHLRQQHLLGCSLEAVRQSRRRDALHHLQIILAQDTTVGQQRRRVVFASGSRKDVAGVLATSHHCIRTVDLATPRTRNVVANLWVSCTVAACC